MVPLEPFCDPPYSAPMDLDIVNIGPQSRLLAAWFFQKLITVAWLYIRQPRPSLYWKHSVHM